MITTKIRALAAARETVERLESQIEAELQSELASLHEDYGFVDVETFIVAVKGAAGNSKATSKTQKRTKITSAIRARVKKLVQAGKSGSSIAKAVGISLPSVQNIKKALGLVKSRVPKKTKERKARKTTAKKTSGTMHLTARETARAELATA